MPEGLRTYKKKEKLFYARLVAGMKSVLWATVSMPRRLARWAGQRYTVSLLPHSAARARRLQTPRIVVVAVIAAAAGLLGFSVFATARYVFVAAQLDSARRELAQSRQAIDAMRDGAESLTGAALKFETSLSELLSVVQKKKGTSASEASTAALSVAGLAGLLNLPDSSGLGSRELQRLEGLSSYLDSAAPGLEEVATLLAGQKEIMSEIPNIWPISGGLGHISMYFGQNENPFSSGQWYLHNGIDISTFRTGDAILAAADGKVIDVSYDPSLGNCVTIQHSHGFLTRYGHLRAFRVAKGQQVTQGQVIATLGNTGKTTGAHLHYEVHLGTSVIDPLRFLNVRKTATL